MSRLNQEVSNLAKELHEMMHFLHTNTHHFLSPLPPYSSYSSTNVTQSPSDWTTGSPYNLATAPICGCGRGSVLGQEVELEHVHHPVSPLHNTCTHTRCFSDQERLSALGLESHPSTFQTSRSTPNSPCLSHPAGQPLSCQVSPMSRPGMMVPEPILTNSLNEAHFSHASLSHSHTCLNLQSTPDLTSLHSAPIHISLTPTSRSQPRTAVSPLLRAEIHSTSLLQIPTGLRQNDLVGSSPVHVREPMST